jgi:hypothetical protein
MNRQYVQHRRRLKRILESGRLASRVVDPDPHYFWKLDPYPHEREKRDPDPHRSQNSESSEAKKSPVDAHYGGQKA